jgi:hypothetical protein
MQGDVTITLDTPLRLKDAVRIAFPHGRMTVSGLKTEHRRGRVQFEKIANKHFVTLRAIEDMRKRCRDIPKEPVSISASDVAVKLCGSSSTEKTKSALAAAQAIADGLKRPSPATSPASTSQTGKIVTLQR